MYRTTALAAGLGAAVVAAPLDTRAHVIVGPRVFPVTLTFDDPGTADEATLPQVTLAPGSDGAEAYAVQWEYDKTITPNTALIYNQGYDILTQRGAKTQTGFENVAITAKWQAITDADTESVVSLGVIRVFAGGSHTQAVGGDTFGSTVPSLYFGQGGGFLPVPLLRPLALSGEVNYVIPDRRLDSTLDNGGSPNGWTGGLSLQYSMPYLQTEVRDFGLPDFVNRLIPLVELTYYSPANAPANGYPMTLQLAPGFIYLADSYQVGLEALIPLNSAAGAGVGFTAQAHFFLDDLFPDSLGRPIFP